MCSLQHVGTDHAGKGARGSDCCLVAQRGHEHIVGMEAWQRGLTRKVGVRATRPCTLWRLSATAASLMSMPTVLPLRPTCS